jgi:predicted Zn-dependent peptidase
MVENQRNETRVYNMQSLKKFSTITVDIAFLQEQDKVEREARNVVSKVLPEVSAAFPTRMATKSYLADLYAARVYSSVQRRGDKHVVSFQFVFTDPKIVQDENYQMSDIVTCIRRILLEPKLVDGVFLPDVVELENKLLQAYIVNMEDDKSTYAQLQLLKYMFEGTPFGTRAYGNLAHYPALTATKVYETYEKMLNEDSLLISVVGDVDARAFEAQLAEMLTSTGSQSKPLSTAKLMLRPHKQVQSFTELQHVNQTRIHIGYRIPATVYTADYFIHKVAIDILGGSGQSKLFQNVRERASLAYSVSASIDDFAEAMYIYAGVERDKVSLAQDIIRAQVEAMQAGEITNEELQFAKDNLVHRISMAQDSAFALLGLTKKLLDFKNVSTLNRWKQELESVRLEDVIAASKTWVEDTVFILTSPDTNEGSEA